MIIESIGPYQLKGQIGSGGMGAVFKAWDSRLERWVAIKTILPSRELSDERLERFRREARSNASINHPSVAQVFDIVSKGDRDHIIMELVEGTTIEKILRDGPMTPERSVFIAHQISEGLGAAHKLGLIHRDLKAANVMVSEQDRAKILDFGLAKIIEPDQDTPDLTEEGMVIGTCRSMSPEQAEGKQLDHRSDLFSLGSLIFRMVTGEHPFASSSPVATLRRIVFEEAPNASNLNPNVPPELSDLINRLLSKKVEDRPADANEVAEELLSLSAMWTGPTQARAIPFHSSVTVARLERRNRFIWLASALIIAVLGIVVASQWWMSRPVETTVVAVLQPHIVPGKNLEYASLPRIALRMALLNGISSLEGFVVPDPLEIDALSGTPSEIAQGVSATEILASSIEDCETICRIRLRRLDANGKLLPGGARSFEVLADDLLLLSHATSAFLENVYSDHGPRHGFKKTEANPEDFIAYVAARSKLDHLVEGVDLDKLLTEFETIRRRSPEFLEAHIAEARTARFLFDSSADAGYLERARAAIDRALKLAPLDPRPLVAAIDICTSANELNDASAFIETLANIDPSYQGLINARAKLALLRGNSDSAIKLLEQAVRIRPSWRNLRDLADAEFRSGRTESATIHLNEALILAPSNSYLKAQLGQFELIAGNFRAATVLFSELTQQHPRAAYFANLGLARMMLREFSEAITAFSDADRLSPGNPVSLLNLGDCYTLLGDSDTGKTLYAQALKMTEGLVESLDNLSVRAQCLAHLDHAPEAVKAVLREVSLAPDDPQSRYDAALVHAIIDDRNAAAVYASQAVELGMDAAWLKLPWFDKIDWQEASPKPEG